MIASEVTGVTSKAERDAWVLPTVPPGADLAASRISRRWMALCFGITFLVYVAFVPHFLLYSSPPTGDQPYYLMDTVSLAQDGDLNVRNNYEAHDYDKFYGLAPHPPDFVGMGFSGSTLSPDRALATARPETEWYSFHEPGLPVWLVPAWIVGSWFGLWWPATIVFMCLVGALVALNIFLLAHEMTGEVWIAMLVWVACAFSNPLMSYSYLIFTELPTGLLLIYALRRLALGWTANGPLRLLLVGASIGYVPWLAWRCLPIAIGLGIYALVQWRRAAVGSRQSAVSSPQSGPVLPTANRLLPTAYWLVPVVISALLLTWYHLFLYGTLSPNTLLTFYWPWEGSEEFNRFFTAAFGHLFDRQNGLLVHAPVYLLAAVGMIAMFRSGRASDLRLLAALALVSLPYLSVVTAFEGWNGIWSPPARYLTTFAPLLAMPLSMSLFACRGWLYRVIFGALALPGFAFMAAMMSDPRVMWPGFGRDLVKGMLRTVPFARLETQWEAVWNALPAFPPGIDIFDEVRLPLASLWIVAASVLIVLTCYLLSLSAEYRVPSTEHRDSLAHSVQGPRYSVLKRSALVWVGAIAVLGLGWLAVNFDYAKHRTVLTVLHRWELHLPAGQAQGIAYMDGKVYVTTPSGQSLGRFDLTTATYEALVQPKSAQGALTYSNPGDVKVGPDHLLYVLNNGEGSQAVYGMRADGQVIHQVPLDDKPVSAAGLAFGPDRSIYVTDMGRVIKYASSGGKPVLSWGGPGKGFNNVLGIAVDESGMVFAAEIGGQRVYEFDPDGRLVVNYDIRCAPRYIAIQGDWVDVSCQRGIVSINKKQHYVQRFQGGENTDPPREPMGITYGDKNTIFLLEGNILGEFRIEH